MSGVIRPVIYSIEDASRLLETFKPDECIRLPVIYQHFPGVSFYLYLYPAGYNSARGNYTSFYVECVFDPADRRRVASVWGLWKCGLYKAGHAVGAEDVPFGPEYQVSVHVYTARLGASGSGFEEAWKHDIVRSCIRSDGTLHVRLELNLFNFTDLVNEQSLPLPLDNLEDNLSDFKILANGKEYRVHRSILVESPVLARLFDSKTKETHDMVLDLKNTATCVAVEALLNALYQKRWDNKHHNCKNLRPVVKMDQQCCPACNGSKPIGEFLWCHQCSCLSCANCFIKNHVTDRTPHQATMWRGEAVASACLNQLRTRHGELDAVGCDIKKSIDHAIAEFKLKLHENVDIIIARKKAKIVDAAATIGNAFMSASADVDINVYPEERTMFKVSSLLDHVKCVGGISDKSIPIDIYAPPKKLRITCHLKRVATE